MLHFDARSSAIASSQPRDNTDSFLRLRGHVKVFLQISLPAVRLLLDYLAAHIEQG